jgi:hypothetical protein
MKLWIAIFALLVCCGAASICAAHPAMYVSANVKVNRDGTFRIHARFDVLAFALNDTPARIDDSSMNELLDGPREDLDAALIDARDRLLHGVTIRCDDSTIIRASSIQFPTVADVYRWRDANVQPRLPVIQEATLDGSIPPAARAIAIKFPEVLGTLVLTVERPAEEAYAEPLEGGRFSSTLPVHLQPQSLVMLSGTPRSILPDASDQIPRGVPLRMTAVSEPGTLGAAAKYFALGFTHILPYGFDHVLFVVGLFLLSPRLKPLLAQVTAFTIAHSITLGLSLYNIVRLPPTVVEPLIALSIAFIAIENLCTTKLKPWRPIVVFGFGLVHGLGFAGVLQDVGLPRSQFAAALLSFNGGVELGQLAVLLIAFAMVGLFRSRTWYRSAIAMPASFAIAAIAVVWTIQRIYQ